MHNKFYISSTAHNIPFYIYAVRLLDRHHNSHIIFAYIIIRMYKYAACVPFHSKRDEKQKQNLKYINNSIRWKVRKHENPIKSLNRII